MIKFLKKLGNKIFYREESVSECDIINKLRKDISKEITEKYLLNSKKFIKEYDHFLEGSPPCWKSKIKNKKYKSIYLLFMDNQKDYSAIIFNKYNGVQKVIEPYEDKELFVENFIKYFGYNDEKK